MPRKRAIEPESSQEVAISAEMVKPVKTNNLAAKAKMVRISKVM